MSTMALHNRTASPHLAAILLAVGATLACFGSFGIMRSFVFSPSPVMDPSITIPELDSEPGGSLQPRSAPAPVGTPMPDVKRGQQIPMATSAVIIPTAQPSNWGDILKCNALPTGGFDCGQDGIIQGFDSNGNPIPMGYPILQSKPKAWGKDGFSTTSGMRQRKGSAP